MCQSTSQTRACRGPQVPHRSPSMRCRYLSKSSPLLEGMRDPLSDDSVPELEFPFGILQSGYSHKGGLSCPAWEKPPGLAGRRPASGALHGALPGGGRSAIGPAAGAAWSTRHSAPLFRRHGVALARSAQAGRNPLDALLLEVASLPLAPSLFLTVSPPRLPYPTGVLGTPTKNRRVQPGAPVSSYCPSRGLRSCRASWSPPVLGAPASAGAAGVLAVAACSKLGS